MAVPTVRLNAHGQVTLPKSVREAANLGPGAEFAVEAGPDGSIVLRPTRDPEQWWFWTERWQRMEREADADIADGRYIRYTDEGTFLRSFEESTEVGGADNHKPTDADV